MKNSFMIALAVVSTSIFSVSAYSNSTVQIQTDVIHKLPVVTQANVTVDMPHPMTPVQPTAFLNVNFSSCSKLKLEAAVEEHDGVLFASVFLPAGQRDCRGPAITRLYSMQISSDFKMGTRVVVLNPAPILYSK